MDKVELQRIKEKFKADSDDMIDWNWENCESLRLQPEDILRLIDAVEATLE